MDELRLNMSGLLQPVDYSVEAPDPMGNFAQGFKQAQAVREMDRSNVEYDKKIKREELINQLLQKDNLTVKDVAPLIAVADPQQSKQLAASFSMLSSEQQQNKIKLAAQVMSALNAGQPEIAAKLMRDQAEAQRNAGDENGAHFSEVNAQQIEVDPKHSLLTGATFLASIGEEGHKVLNSLSNFQNSQANLENGPINRDILREKLRLAQEENSPENQELRANERKAKISSLEELANERKAKAAATESSKVSPDGVDYIAKYAEETGHDLIANKTLITKSQMEQFQRNAAKMAASGKEINWDNLLNDIKEKRQAQSTGASAGSSKIKSQRENIDNALALLDDMKATNEKLDFSRLKYKGSLESWANDMVNDPEFVRYRTQRADSLFQLTNALKQNGITDKALEIEDQTNKLSMPKKAFLEWYNVQKELLTRAKSEKDKSYGPRVDYSGNSSKESKAASTAADFMRKYGRR